MMPPAPGRFSTSTGCLNASLRCLATMRPAMSAPEPGVSGTMMRIARVGYSCASAVPATSSTADARNLAAVFIAPPKVERLENDDQQDHREDDDDDQEQIVVGEPAARGKHVDLARDRVHFLVREGGDARLGLVGRNAHRLQLLDHLRALHEGAKLFPVGVRLGG